MTPRSVAGHTAGAPEAPGRASREEAAATAGTAQEVPPDVLAKIAGHMGPAELVAGAAVSREWRRAALGRAPAALTAVGVAPPAHAPTACGQMRQLARALRARRDPPAGQRHGTRVLAAGLRPTAGVLVPAALGHSGAPAPTVAVTHLAPVGAVGAVVAGDSAGRVVLCHLPLGAGGGAAGGARASHVGAATARTLVQLSGRITALCVACDGRTVAVGAADGSVALVGPVTDAAARPRRLPGGATQRAVTALAFCDNDRALAVADARALSLWCVATQTAGQPLRLSSVPAALAVAPGPAPAGRPPVVLVANLDATVDRVAPAPHGGGWTPAGRARGHWARRPDGRAVAVAAELHLIGTGLRDLTADRAPDTVGLVLPPDRSAAVTTSTMRLVLSADSALLAAAQPPELAVWELADPPPAAARGAGGADGVGREACGARAAFTDDDEEGPLGEAVEPYRLGGWPHLDSALAFSPIAPHLLAASRGGRAMLWAPRRETTPTTLVAPPGAGDFTCAAFAADGTVAFIGDSRGNLFGWDLGRHG